MLVFELPALLLKITAVTPSPHLFASQVKPDDGEQWLRRVEAAKCQAHPDVIPAGVGEMDALIKEVDTLMQLAPTSNALATAQLLLLKHVKAALRNMWARLA